MLDSCSKERRDQIPGVKSGWSSQLEDGDSRPQRGPGSASCSLTYSFRQHLEGPALGYFILVKMLTSHIGSINSFSKE